MKWSEFYEKADNCEVSTVVKMIPSLEEFGSPKEIADEFYTFIKCLI